MTAPEPSPLLARPGAVPPPPGADGATHRDAGVPWHYGDPLREQRALAPGGAGVVDLGHRPVVRVDGRDRLTWLHSLTTQHVERLEPGGSALALILSPHGHVEHELHLVDDGETTWMSVEPGTAEALVAYLDSMRFMLDVSVADVSDAWAVVWEPVAEADPDRPTWLTPPRYVTGLSGHAFAGREVLLPREDVEGRVTAGTPVGTWAWEAVRVAAGVPRLGAETDHRTIPHELGWIGSAVHLDKGCYRGQETVARVQNLGRPPRRLVLLHLDGSADRLPVHGDDVEHEGRAVGFVGTVAQHHELGPVALAVVKRALDPAAVLVAAGVPATQDVVVEP